MRNNINMRNHNMLRNKYNNTRLNKYIIMLHSRTPHTRSKSQGCS